MKFMTAGQGVVALETFIAFKSVIILPFCPKNPKIFLRYRVYRSYIYDQANI